MNMKNRITIVGLILVSVLIVGFLGMYFDSWNNNRGRDVSNQAEQAFLFVKPALAQSMSTLTFLDEEAGISAYVNINRTIDLALARTAYRGDPEKETSDYLVGSVNVSLSENDDVHCFVHKTGWIVTYYGNNTPLSKIVDWDLWSQTTGKLTKNRLQVGLEKMTNTLGVPLPSPSYYDFQYPSANKCMVILETLVGSGEDSFNVTIPYDLIVYERSWSHYARTTISGWNAAYHSYSKIDGITINSISGVSDPVTKCGTLIVTQLLPGASHVVSVSYEYDNSYLYGVCVALVYQEP
jgi:hypothetical protein